MVPLTIMLAIPLGAQDCGPRSERSFVPRESATLTESPSELLAADHPEEVGALLSGARPADPLTGARKQSVAQAQLFELLVAIRSADVRRSSDAPSPARRCRPTPRRRQCPLQQRPRRFRTATREQRSCLEPRSLSMRANSCAGSYARWPFVAAPSLRGPRSPDEQPAPASSISDPAASATGVRARTELPPPEPERAGFVGERRRYRMVSSATSADGGGPVRV